MLVSGGVAIFLITYLFGRTVPSGSNGPSSLPAPDSGQSQKGLDVQDILRASAARLTPSQSAYVNRLENSVVRGDVKGQQEHAYRQLASFWKDSVREGFLLAAFYTGEAAKLENSEKSLTFAAQLFLDNLPGQDNQGLKTWMAIEAKDLFQRALALNPRDDSAKVGLGGSYIFGAAGNPQEVMEGVRDILEVVGRDSSNMYAQLLLGLGGIESGQFDKAIERLSKVVQNQPGNLEAVLALGEAYERKGDRAAAIHWYQFARKETENPDLIKALDQRIQSIP